VEGACSRRRRRRERFWGGGRVDRFLVLRICRSGMKGMEESSKYNGSASW